MKSKVIIPISNSGILSAHGYSDVRDKSLLARHRALGKVIRAGEPPLGLFRRLNVLMILFKRTDPKLSKIFKKDRDWVKEKYMQITDMYAYLMGRRVEPLAAREPTPEPEPEPEKKSKLGYILVGVMGLILSKLKT